MVKPATKCARVNRGTIGLDLHKCTGGQYCKGQCEPVKPARKTCERCGAVKPVGESCICFDNGCE